MGLIEYARLKRHIDKRFDGIYSVLRAGEFITTWAGVQGVVRAGLADKFFSIGDQFVATFDGQPVVWDVIGIDHDKPTDPRFTHSLTIQSHDCLLNAPFSAPQALYYAEAPLPAGQYRFTLNNVQYTFTTSQVVPAGGQVFISGWGEGNYVPTAITTYAADRTTTIETGLVVTQSAGVDTLFPVNDHRRCRWGSNNYTESAIRQWLNSEDETFVWEPQTPFDRPLTAAPYTGGGFLHRLDPDLVAVLGAVDKQVARNTVTDGGGQDLFSDKVFLLSRVEVYGGTEGVTTGENPYPYYEAMASGPTTDALDGRIKYLGSSARGWWLRSPGPRERGESAFREYQWGRERRRCVDRLRGGPRSSHCIIEGGRDMFKHLSVKEQLQLEQQKSKALQARIQELEDALIELAEIVAANEEELHNG